MTHVMQAQNGQDNIATAANLWIRHWGNYDAAYNFDLADLGQPFSFFNMEQQATIVQSYFDGTFTGDNRIRAGMTLVGFPMAPPPPQPPLVVGADDEPYVWFDDFISQYDPVRPRPLVINETCQCEG